MEMAKAVKVKPGTLLNSVRQDGEPVKVEIRGVDIAETTKRVEEEARIYSKYRSVMNGNNPSKPIIKPELQVVLIRMEKFKVYKNHKLVIQCRKTSLAQVYRHYRCAVLRTRT